MAMCQGGGVASILNPIFPIPTYIAIQELLHTTHVYRYNRHVFMTNSPFPSLVLCVGTRLLGPYFE